MKQVKNILPGIILAGTCLTGCTATSGYNIQGTVAGIEKGNVCLIAYLGKKADTLAKADIKDGKFEMQGNVPGLTVATLQLPGTGMGHAPIYLENAEYKATLNPQNLALSEIAGGGETQRMAHELSAIDRHLSKAIDGIRDEFIKESNNPQSARFQELNAFLDSIQRAAETQKEEFYRKHATGYIALNHLAQNADRLTLDELKAKYNAFPAEMQNSDLGQQIKTQIEKMQTIASGQIAPDFTVQDPAGKPFTLHSIKAKAKIIDFWASWCAPCRALTPELIKLYEEFHPHGLEIVGISLDDKKEAWIKAIEEENIPWMQGSKLDGFKPGNPLNQLYGIQGIPHLVLLDGDNRILTTGSDLKALREMLSTLLRK